MPLPWKKTKPNRISRIVSDFQPTSLVVETGFPTSVVDLFVKNRDRIKKHSLRRKSKYKYKHSPPDDLHLSESVAPPPTPALSPHYSPRLPPHEAVALSAAAASVDDLKEEDSTPSDVKRNNNVVGVRANGNNNANANGKSSLNSSSVFVLTAKMFLAVIPVLSTKKLALGITLSAFLLFLLEILGNFAVRFFNSSSIRNRFFSTAGQRHRDRSIDRGGEEEEEEEEEDEEFLPINSASINEIQIIESNSDNEQLGYDEGLLQREPFPNREKESELELELEMENEEKGKMAVGKNHRSRSSKLKAKIISKLIPKKLRSGKKRMKKNKNEKNKMKQEKGIVIIENEQGTDQSSCEEEEEEEDQEAIWEVHQMWDQPEEEEEEEIGSSSTSTSTTMGKVEEEEEDDDKKDLECKFVILMILVGLCGGRFLALVLTISGCFIFKFIKMLNQKWKFR